eukprot:Gb_28070 [translate_table: standard]
MLTIFMGFINLSPDVELPVDDACPGCFRMAGWTARYPYGSILATFVFTIAKCQKFGNVYILYGNGKGHKEGKVTQVVLPKPASKQPRTSLVGVETMPQKVDNTNSLTRLSNQIPMMPKELKWEDGLPRFEDDLDHGECYFTKYSAWKPTFTTNADQIFIWDLMQARHQTEMPWLGKQIASLGQVMKLLQALISLELNIPIRRKYAQLSVATPVAAFYNIGCKARASIIKKSTRKLIAISCMPITIVIVNERFGRQPIIVYTYAIDIHSKYPDHQTLNIALGICIEQLV